MSVVTRRRLAPSSPGRCASAPTATRSSSSSTPAPGRTRHRPRATCYECRPADSGAGGASSRRLARLPEQTRAALGTAASSAGASTSPRSPTPPVRTEDDLLDQLEPALAAGLVHEAGVDTFAFDHALVRDTVYGRQSTSRRARRHAQVADAARRAGPGRETEARPPPAGRRARSSPARPGARPSRPPRSRWRAHAYPEAAELYRARPRRTGGRPARRTARPVRRAHGPGDGLPLVGQWPQLTATVRRRSAVAEGLGDPVLAAEAAISTTAGRAVAVRRTTATSTTRSSRLSAGAWRRCPTRTPTLRCRCLLSLGNELYYATTFEERSALTDEALAMARPARRPGPPAARLPGRVHRAVDPAHGGRAAGPGRGGAGRWPARSAPSTTRWSRVRCRHRARRARAAARDVGVVAARRGSGRSGCGSSTALLVLDSMVVPWLVPGRTVRRGRGAARADDRPSRASPRCEHADDAIHGNFLTLAIWRDDLAAPRSSSRRSRPMVFPMTVHRRLHPLAGRSGGAGRWPTYAEHEVDLAPDDWFSMLNRC